MDDKGQLHKDAMREERNVPKGEAQPELRGRYYDVTRTILVATANDPGDADAAAYQQERIYDTIQKRASIIHVANDGIDTLFVRVSHDGPGTFSPENSIYPGDIKEYYHVYELRLRSPTIDLPYRVSEYNIMMGCCPTSGTTVLPIQIPSIEKAVIHNTALPAANTNFLTPSITPTSTPCGFIVQIAVSITGIFRATITNAGNTQIVNFNQATALTANSLYIFEMLVHSGDTVNFRYSTTGGIIQILRVQEADSAVI